MKIFILLIAACSLLFVSCQDKPVIEKNSETPFFYLEKGDTVAKGVIRDKPEMDEPTILWTSENTLKGSGQSSGAGYINDLYLSIRKSNSAGATMTHDGQTVYKIPVDLNEKAGGKYIYMYYGKGENPLTMIWVVAQNVYVGGAEANQLNYLEGHGDDTGFIIERYGDKRGDMNAGAGGKFVYGICTRHENWGTPIKDIMIISSSSSKSPTTLANTYPGWIPTITDLNKDAGGKYIYLLFKR